MLRMISVSAMLVAANVVTTTPVLSHTIDEPSTPIVTEPDEDDDGRIDPLDNCPIDPNPTQMDTDEDGIGDACDQEE